MNLFLIFLLLSKLIYRNAIFGVMIYFYTFYDLRIKTHASNMKTPCKHPVTFPFVTFISINNHVYFTYIKLNMYYKLRSKNKFIYFLFYIIVSFVVRFIYPDFANSAIGKFDPDTKKETFLSFLIFIYSIDYFNSAHLQLTKYKGFYI